MTDLRQDVTPTQHEVLDQIETFGADWAKRHSVQLQIGLAGDHARIARDLLALESKRQHAIHAGARLIVAAEQLARLIDAGAA